MIYDYIKERYGNLFNNEDELLYAAVLKYMKHLETEQARVITTSDGFLTYSLRGDACIIWDLYTTKEARSTGSAHDLFNKVLLVLEKAGKRVIIGFSEKLGQNHKHGIGAMKAVGFIPAFETEVSTIFMRGA